MQFLAKLNMLLLYDHTILFLVTLQRGKNVCLQEGVVKACSQEFIHNRKTKTTQIFYNKHTVVHLFNTTQQQNGQNKWMSFKYRLGRKKNKTPGSKGVHTV